MTRGSASLHKKKIKVNQPELMGSIISWMWTKSVWYGAIFDAWWLEEGAQAFTNYAKKHKTEFQKEPDVKLLKELYMTCARGGNAPKETK